MDTNRMKVVLFCLGVALNMVCLPSVFAMDPTQPYPHKQAQLADAAKTERLAGSNAIASMTVSMIIYSKQRRFVIINDKPYFAGDTIDGYTVAQVRQHEVVLNKNGIDAVIQVAPAATLE
jgi:hypothetical protein